MAKKGFMYGLNVGGEDYGGSNWIKSLRLKDGERAKIRFLTEGDEVVRALYHSVPIPEKTYRKEVFCRSMLGEDCELCVQQNKKNLKWHAWVYVYHILKTSIPEGDNIDLDKIEIVKVGEKTYYKQSVNDVRVLRMGPGKGKYLTNKLMTLYQTYGSLMDRDYTWIRSGAKMENTNYELLPEAPSDFEYTEAEIPYALEDVCETWPKAPGNDEVKEEKDPDWDSELSKAQEELNKRKKEASSKKDNDQEPEEAAVEEKEDVDEEEELEDTPVGTDKLLKQLMEG